MPEIYLLFLLFSFLLFSAIKVFSLRTKKLALAPIDLSQVTVVIPFRNEAENLPLLLDSILNQSCYPSEIIFVDDHSNDVSSLVIQSFIKSHAIGHLVALKVNETGKKAALNYGIQLAKSRFILTMDADVVLNKNYFSSLAQLSGSGLAALPVVMNGVGVLGRLFSTEYSFFNAFNYLISNIWPVSISGANLLFDSKLIDYKVQLKSHQHLASGDDYFLLKNFRKNNLPIHINNEYDLRVSTDSPATLKAYFDQRVRWLSKSNFQIDRIDSLIGIFILIYFIFGFIALLIAAFHSEWMLLGSIFILRLLIDSLVYLNYGQRLIITKNIVMLPFFQLIYPLFFTGVAVLSVFYKPNWRGRSLEGDGGGEG